MNKFHFGRLFLSTFILILFASINLASQCVISDLVVTNSDCDADDKFSAEINFNFENTGNSGFQILGNGNNYGTFQYANLPVIIEGLIGNCDIEFEFIVRDVDDPTCASFYELGTVCCDEECQISIIDFATTDCVDNVSFGISLDLDYSFEGNDGFAVSINGTAYGNYNYEDLPLNIDDIVSMEEGLNSVTICDNIFTECCDTYTFLNPCVCGMTNITSKIIDCNSEDSTYFVVIDFDHVATNDSFQMGYSNSGNNTFLGTFAYIDLPITAGPLFISEDDQEILIVDTENFFCFNSAYLGIVDDCNIECQLFNLSGEAYMCEEGEYFMDIEFLAKDIEGSTFEVLVDGINYGTFVYGENFYTVGPIPSDCENAPVLIVQDSEMESCSDFYNFPEPICCLPECNFTSFEATTECSSSTVTVNGTFENNGTMLSGFYFVEFLGTSYGPFSYGDFTFSIEIPLISDGEYQITINDSFDPECQISTFFTVQCEEQPCIIFDVFAEASECEENIFFVNIEFDFAGEVSDSFEILGNGMNYGTFVYGEQFYTVGPIEGDCETIYEFMVSDQVFEGCNSVYIFQEPICCLEECSIRDIEVLDFICESEDSISTLVLNFVSEGNASEMFILSIDDVELGSYLYSDLPITLDIKLSIFFVIDIQDSENSNCRDTKSIALECPGEGCTLNNGILTRVDCSEEFENYFLELTVDHDDSGEVLEIYISDTLYASINYFDLPFVFGPFDLGVPYDIFVNDSEAEAECGINFTVLFLMCTTAIEEDSFSKINIIQSTHQINIENNEPEGLKFRLFNTTGALVNSLSIDSNQSNWLDTSHLPKGLYFLNISNDKRQKTLKVIVY